MDRSKWDNSRNKVVFASYKSFILYGRPSQVDGPNKKGDDSRTNN